MTRKRLTKPCKTVRDGQDAKGRFAPGNKLSKGNPVAHQTARARAKFHKAIDDKKFYKLAMKLYKQALRGQPWAMKLVFEYKLGKPTEGADFLQQIADMEKRLLGESLI